jgi:hypothetical protein
MRTAVAKRPNRLGHPKVRASGRCIPQVPPARARALRSGAFLRLRVTTRHCGSRCRVVAERAGAKRPVVVWGVCPRTVRIAVPDVPIDAVPLQGALHSLCRGVNTGRRVGTAGIMPAASWMQQTGPFQERQSRTWRSGQQCPSLMAGHLPHKDFGQSERESAMWEKCP